MPPLTSAERAKRHRLKLINNEEYKDKERLRKRQYYINKFKNGENISNKPLNANIEEFKILKPISKRINPINTSVLNDKTIEQYSRIIRILYKKYNNGEDIDDMHEIFKSLKSEKYDYKIIGTDFKFIKTDIINIIKDNFTYIRDIYAIFTRIRGFAKEIKQIYPYLEEKQKIYDTNRKNREVTDTIKKQIDLLSFEEEDIKNNLNNKSLTSFEKLIYGLFTLFPTRRAKDYRIMMITNVEPKDDKTHNYYYNGKFYFFITKNKKKDIYDVPALLQELINTDDGYLLGEEYSNTQLSKIIMSVFKKIYDVSFSAVEIRRLYATYINKKGLNYKEREIISNMMNHRVEENIKYAY